MSLTPHQVVFLIEISTESPAQKGETDESETKVGQKPRHERTVQKGQNTGDPHAFTTSDQQQQRQHQDRIM
jgi:hypothetical protein